MSKFSDMELTKILDMIEFLHAENLFIINLMLSLHMKRDEAEKSYKEIEQHMTEEFEKCRKRW